MPGTTLYPFVVSTLAWESRPEQWYLTICLKATFTLAPRSPAEEPELAAPQDGSHDDVLFDQAPHASLYSPSDFVPFKPRADILLVGHAHAPAGAPVDSLVVRVRVGDFSKALRVHGDRSWAATPQGPRPSMPRPFARMPLRYERAWRKGDNAAGIPAGDTTRPPANIDVVTEEGPAETPGLGPIAPSWRALRDQRAQDALIWAQRLRSAPAPAPAGLDPAVFNAAPRDQQILELAPSAPLVLENLHPRAARLETHLPSIVPCVFHVDPVSGQPREVQARMDTLWIDTDRDVFVVSWRGFTGMSAPGATGIGRVLVAAHAPGQAHTFEEVDALSRPRSAPPAARAAARRAPPQTTALPAMPDPAPAPFPLASPASSSEAGAAPIAGAPWAGIPAAPVPRPDINLAGTLPLGASIDLFLKPNSARKAPATVAMQARPEASPAPFPLAAPAAGAASENVPIAGAPWTGLPAAPVPRPDINLAGTMPLGASIADVVAKVLMAASARAASPAPVMPPPVVAPAVTPPAPEPAPPPPVAAPPPPPPPSPAKAVWREDAPQTPAAPPPTAAPPPPEPDKKKQVYGNFSRKR